MSICGLYPLTLGVLRPARTVMRSCPYLDPLSFVAHSVRLPRYLPCAGTPGHLPARCFVVRCDRVLAEPRSCFVHWERRTLTRTSQSGQRTRTGYHRAPGSYACYNENTAQCPLRRRVNAVPWADVYTRYTYAYEYSVSVCVGLGDPTATTPRRLSGFGTRNNRIFHLTITMCLLECWNYV